MLCKTNRQEASGIIHRMLPSHPELPPKPLPPEGYDCCGGGCADCELRLYIKRLKAWQQLVEAKTSPPSDSAELSPQSGG